MVKFLISNYTLQTTDIQAKPRISSKKQESLGQAEIKNEGVL